MRQRDGSEKIHDDNDNQSDDHKPADLKQHDCKHVDEASLHDIYYNNYNHYNNYNYDHYNHDNQSNDHKPGDFKQYACKHVD